MVIPPVDVVGFAAALGALAFGGVGGYALAVMTEASVTSYWRLVDEDENYDLFWNPIQSRALAVGTDSEDWLCVRYSPVPPEDYVVASAAESWYDQITSAAD